MTLSIYFNEEDARLLENYCAFHGISASKAVKQAIIEKIEDEYDEAMAEKAIREFEKNPKTIPFEEVKKRLGI